MFPVLSVSWVKWSLTNVFQKFTVTYRILMWEACSLLAHLCFHNSNLAGPQHHLQGKLNPRLHILLASLFPNPYNRAWFSSQCLYSFPLLCCCPCFPYAWGKWKCNVSCSKNYEDFEGDDNMALNQCTVPLKPCVIAQICRPMKPALACFLPWEE